MTITGISGTLTQTATVTLVVSASPDFVLGVHPHPDGSPGAPTTYGVTITPANGFTGQVTLGVTGLPSGANGSFSPNPTTGSSTLTVTASSSTPVGAYTLTITAVSGALSHTATVTLVVLTPDFALSASPSSQTITQGGSTSYGVTINPVKNDFTGQVALSLSGLPTGANGSFSPNLATTSSTLSVTTSSSTPAGTYTLTISGTSGGLIHATTVSLIVVPAGVVYDNKVIQASSSARPRSLRLHSPSEPAQIAPQ